MLKRQSDHALQIQRLDIEAKKLELKLRQEERLASRKHQELMKELELDIRTQEAKWGQILRIPVMIVKLPLYLCFGIAFIVATAKGDEINQGDYWKLLR